MKTKHLLQFMLLVMAFTSCEKEELSDKNNINSFIFKVENNNTLKKDIKARITLVSIDLVVPVELDLKNLSPTVLFEGVSIFPENEEVIDFSTAIKYVVTAENGKKREYPLNIKKECTVTFDSNGGSIIEDVKVIQHSGVIQPVDPVLEYYNLVGWETEDGEMYPFKIPVTTNFILKAKWELSNISVDGNWEVEYDEVTGDATIVAFLGDETVVEIVIPSTINNHKVVGVIGDNNQYYVYNRSIFSENINFGVNIRKIDLSNAIHLTRIERSSFTKLNSLEELILPPNLEYIGESAFSECLKLTKLIMPNKLLEIGQFAFTDCNLGSVNFPSSLKHIGSTAFSGNNIINLDLYPTQIDSLHIGAFYECNLSSVILPKSLIHMDDFAFSNNPNLTYVEINRDVAPYTNFTDLPLSNWLTNPFTDTPIDNGSQEVTIYYPKETDYPNMDGWKDLDVIWTHRLY